MLAKYFFEFCSICFVIHNSINFDIGSVNAFINTKVTREIDLVGKLVLFQETFNVFKICFLGF